MLLAILSGSHDEKSMTITISENNFVFSQNFKFVYLSFILHVWIRQSCIKFKFSIFSDCLEDEHVLELSKRIANETDLNEFGVKVLQMPQYDIDAALTNHPREIQMAAHDILKKWVIALDKREIAYNTLIKNLQQSDLRNWTNKLKDIVHGKEEKAIKMAGVGFLSAFYLIFCEFRKKPETLRKWHLVVRRMMWLDLINSGLRMNILR